ncbi:MAG: hypothetical protein NT147_07555 [Candidatus Aminicenantes bacterium]|nr:hypothetical protein [Candidatus Aminicenantes bacterium]
MNTTMNEFGVADPSINRRQAKRFDEIALALVLIMTGGLWLAPKAMFPEGTWLVGVGLILLGLNAARRIRGLKTSGFGIIVGLIASAAGIGRIIGQDLPLVPILLIILGAGLVLKAAAGKERPDGMPDAS